MDKTRHLRTLSWTLGNTHWHFHHFHILKTKQLNNYSKDLSTMIIIVSRSPNLFAHLVWANSLKPKYGQWRPLAEMEAFTPFITEHDLCWIRERECVHVHACVFVAYFAAAVKEACCIFSPQPPPLTPRSTSKLVPLFTLPCPIFECKAALVKQEVAPSVRPRVEGMGQGTAGRTRCSPRIRNLVCDQTSLHSREY